MKSLFLLLGHLFGDYVFQTKWMAFNKKEESLEGTLACFVHCCVYTLFVCTFMSVVTNVYISTVILVFLSHWIIDKYKVVEWWCDQFKIRTWYSEVDFDSLPPSKEEAVHIAFGSLVYVVIDNTFHILLLLLIFY